jgi:hypothetical protein
MWKETAMLLRLLISQARINRNILWYLNEKLMLSNIKFKTLNYGFGKFKW